MTELEGCALEQCKEHSGIKANLENMDRALLQVMEELKTRKLTPMTVWIISIMSGTIGGMGIWILNKLGEV